MLQPATVGSARTFGHRRAEVWCNDCHHHAEVSMDGLPDDLPIPDISLRYRCSKCGSKNLMSRGSIDEHYELIEQRSGKAIGNGSKHRS
ncbi:hypothetical protein B6S44_09300 [Bosea sp. Tri-44]|uniref:hypothetical protein n=1 Tax=Bosea sp. Tri-44 TaxID=1972137 RepID=UPI00100E60A3|nr:hypothetical protein [Bosea sp. Tri-44]RXT55671.1 hypothetical protein B6S44_09300 [Bosea sp. Tri-44]